MIISLQLVCNFKASFLESSAEMVHVGWSALRVGFLTLYLAFSLHQAPSNGVEDTDECERWRSAPALCLPEPQCSRLYLLSARV